MRRRLLSRVQMGRCRGVGSGECKRGLHRRKIGCGGVSVWAAPSWFVRGRAFVQVVIVVGVLRVLPRGLSSYIHSMSRPVAGVYVSARGRWRAQGNRPRVLLGRPPAVWQVADRRARAELWRVLLTGTTKS